MENLIDLIIPFHSIIRYVILLLLVATIIKSYSGWKGNKNYVAGDNKLSLGTFVMTHVQLLLGLILYFFGSKGMSMLNQGMGDVMSNSVSRFFLVEHFLGMFIAVVLITLGRILSKKKILDVDKHKTIFIYYFIAFIIILVSIPWPFRNLGTNWF